MSVLFQVLSHDQEKKSLSICFIRQEVPLKSLALPSNRKLRDTHIIFGKDSLTLISFCISLNLLTFPVTPVLLRQNKETDLVRGTDGSHFYEKRDKQNFLPARLSHFFQNEKHRDSFSCRQYRYSLSEAHL